MSAHRTALRMYRRLNADTAGATVIEYATITFLVSVAIGFLLSNLNGALNGLYERLIPDIQLLTPIPSPGSGSGS